MTINAPAALVLPDPTQEPNPSIQRDASASAELPYYQIIRNSAQLFASIDGHWGKGVGLVGATKDFGEGVRAWVLHGSDFSSDEAVAKVVASLHRQFPEAGWNSFKRNDWENGYQWPYESVCKKLQRLWSALFTYNRVEVQEAIQNMQEGKAFKTFEAFLQEKYPQERHGHMKQDHSRWTRKEIDQLNDLLGQIGFCRGKVKQIRDAYLQWAEQERKNDPSLPVHTPGAIGLQARVLWQRRQKNLASKTPRQRRVPRSDTTTPPAWPVSSSRGGYTTPQFGDGASGTLPIIINPLPPMDEDMRTVVDALLELSGQGQSLLQEGGHDGGPVQHGRRHEGRVSPY